MPAATKRPARKTTPAKKTAPTQAVFVETPIYDELIREMFDPKKVRLTRYE